MNILITGARGMLGSCVKDILIGHHMYLTDYYELDVSDYKQVMKYKDYEIDYIFHLAAETNLEFCEEHYKQCYKHNTIGTHHMTQLARVKNIPIVYISTAGVFSGHSEMYFDNSKPNPINHYGMSKFYGEQAVRGWEKHYIFRAGWMFGGGKDKDHKFVSLIMKQLENEVIFAIDDNIGCPTYTRDLMSTIKEAVVDNPILYGTYNCCGGGIASRYDVAKEIVSLTRSNAKVIPVNSDYFKSDFPVKRPQYECLDNDTLNRYGKNKMRGWRVALQEYLEERW